jgi:hypothetical protein
MATDLHHPKLPHHSIVRGGYSFRLARLLGFEPPTTHRRLTKVFLLILVTWVPLVILSILSGHAWGKLVEEPLLLAPVVYSRFLFVVPLLELAQLIVESRCSTLLIRGLCLSASDPSLPPREKP